VGHVQDRFTFKRLQAKTDDVEDLDRRLRDAAVGRRSRGELWRYL
jgi:hypothetical protein